MGSSSTLAEFFADLGFADYQPEPGGMNAPDLQWPAVKRYASPEVMTAHGKVIPRGGAGVGLQSAGTATRGRVAVFGWQVPVWTILAGLVALVAWLKRS